MKFNKSFFGKDTFENEVYLYEIENSNHLKARISTLGATLVGMDVPDKEGNFADVVLGFDSAEEYCVKGGCLGATVGPNANRIKNAEIEIDGKKYLLQKNNGENNLHSHFLKGYQNRIWKADETGNGIVFSIEEKDGEAGFPGNKHVEVTYRLDDDNELHIIYHAYSDKKTVINLTNHSYFNLNGHGEGTVSEHRLMLWSDAITAIDEGSVPTGEIRSVKGTPMDFSVLKPIGRDIAADYDQLLIAGGYDHNYIVNDYDGSLRKIAYVEADERSCAMEVYTTLPGVQFYTGNFLNGEKGKNGARYNKRAGLCLETQYFPDSIHHVNFPPCLFGEGKDYISETVYKFIR